MEKNDRYIEVIVRMIHSYSDLWFKDKFIEFMKSQNGVSSVDLLFEFSLFKNELTYHFIEDFKMGEVFSENLIQHMVEDKYDKHLKALISSLS